MDRASVATWMLAAAGLLAGGCDGPATSSSPPATTPSTPPPSAGPAPAAANAPEEPSAAEETQAVPAVPPKAEAKTAKFGWVELSELGLRGDAPPSTTVTPGKAAGSLFVRGPDLFVVVMSASEAQPATVAEADKAVPTSATDVTPEEIEGGWSLRYAAETEWGPIAFVRVRRTIDGSEHWCESTVRTAEQQAAALAFCYSLDVAPQ